jgi:hypothetical protein
MSSRLAVTVTASDQDVAHGAAADPGDRAEDDRLTGAEPEVESLARPRHREEAQARRVEQVDRQAQPVQPARKGEGDQPAGRGDREVAPVVERGRRDRPDDEIAQDAAAECGDHPQGHDADDVEPRRPYRGQRTVEGEHERPDEIEDEQQRR